MSKSKANLLRMFPNVSPQTIDEVLHFYFPDETAAMKELNPLSSTMKIRKVQITALNEARNALEEAERRMNSFEKNAAKLMQQRVERQNNIKALPPGQERSFMESVEEMKSQKDTAWIEDNRKRLQKALTDAKKHLESQENLLTGDHGGDDDEMIETKKKLRNAWAAERNKVFSIEDRVKQFEEILLAREKETNMDEESLENARKSNIADTMYKTLGAKQFARLQEGMLNYSSYVTSITLFLIS